jgi:hypothetical protein
LDAEVEKMYHVFIFGMILTLGYKCRSNRESGFGRYDLFVEAPSFVAIIEFKHSNSEEEMLEDAEKAIVQIDAKKYFAQAEVENANVPQYNIGIACYKKQCAVNTVERK